MELTGLKGTVEAIEAEVESPSSNHKHLAELVVKAFKELLLLIDEPETADGAVIPSEGVEPNPDVVTPETITEVS